MASARTAGVYEMAPVGAAGHGTTEVVDARDDAPTDASALEQGETEDSANVPSVFKRNQAKRRCQLCAYLSPAAVCAFVAGVLSTLIIVAIARDPIQSMASGYLCEPPAEVSADVVPGGIVPAPPILVDGEVEKALNALKGDLTRLVEHIMAGRARGEAYNRTALFVDTFGHRQAGSESLEHSLEDLLAMLPPIFGAGNVRSHPFSIPRWVRGREACSLISPLVGFISYPARTLEILGLGFSVGTDGPLEADVVVATSLAHLVELHMKDLVKERIVLFDMPYLGYGKTRPFRTHCASFAAKFGAKGLLLRSIGPFSLNSPHTGSMTYRKGQLTRATADGLGFGAGGVPMELLGDYDGVPEIPAAAMTKEDAAMIHRMLVRGTLVRVRLEMEGKMENSTTTRNVIVDIVGSDKPDEVVVVSGHIDSWDVGQGALDDAAPSFVCLQTLLSVKALNLQPRRTLRMIFWSAEEIGSLGGKSYFESNLLPTETLAIAIELDFGIMNPSGIQLRADKSTFDVARWVGSKVLSSIGGQVYADPTFGTSDMYFWLSKNGATNGIPAMTIAHKPASEHAASVSGVGGPVWPDKWQGDYFFYHHTHADTMEILDSGQMDRSAAIIAAHAYTIASLPDMPSRGEAKAATGTDIVNSCFRSSVSSQCV